MFNAFLLLQETPADFFGLPFDDDTLHDAPFVGSNGILTACNGVLHDIGRRDIYDDHLTSKLPGTEVKKSFLMELSKLDPEDKQRCFEEIVNALEKGGKGLKHIRDRLIEGVWNEITLITEEKEKKTRIITFEFHRNDLKIELREHHF